MKHPSWANYIVKSHGRHFYLDELKAGYRHATLLDDGSYGKEFKSITGDILRDMTGYEFIGEEEN